MITVMWERLIVAEKAWGGVFDEATDRRVETVHRKRELRPPALCARHRRLRSPMPKCWPRSGCSPPTNATKLGRHWQQIRPEIEQGKFAVPHRAGRHPHAHRAGADRAARRRRPQAAHRPQPQRSGRDRPAALGARRDRPDRRAAGRRATGVRRPLRSRCGRHSARLHALAAGPAGAGRRIIGWPIAKSSSAIGSGWPIAGKRVNVLSLGAAALAGTSLPIDRDDVARRLGFRRRGGQQSRCFERPRFRARIRRSPWR